MKFFSKFGFYLINFIIAGILLTGIGLFILKHLDSYTNHGETITVPAFYRLSQNEVANLAQQNELQVVVRDSLYNKNELPGVILEQYPLPGAQVKSNRLIHLTVNMQSPEKVIFPNLRNSAYRQSVQSIEAIGLRMGRITYEPSEFKNLVLGFSCNGVAITPGDEISKGAIIDIILGQGIGSNRVAMPRVVGLTYRKAAGLIRQSFLNTDSLFMDETVDLTKDFGNCWIYMQTPRADSLISAGSGVKLYLTNSKKIVAAADSLNIDN